MLYGKYKYQLLLSQNNNNELISKINELVEIFQIFEKNKIKIVNLIHNAGMTDANVIKIKHNDKIKLEEEKRLNEKIIKEKVALINEKYRIFVDGEKIQSDDEIATFFNSYLDTHTKINLAFTPFSIKCMINQHIKDVLYSLDLKYTAPFELKMNNFSLKEISILLEVSINSVSYRVNLVRDEIRTRILCE